MSRNDETVTPRQTEVCALVTTGMTNKEIGRKLRISSNTVANHLADVYRRLGIRSRNKLSFFIQRHYFVRGRQLVRRPSTKKPFAELTKADTKRSQV